MATSQYTWGGSVPSFGMAIEYIQLSHLYFGQTIPTALANESSYISSIWKTDPLGLNNMSLKASSTGALTLGTNAIFLPGP